MADFHSVNPATGETGKSYPQLDDAALDGKLEAAHQAFRRWRTSAPEERSALLSRLSDQLLADKEAIARTVTAEMGKPLADAVAEVEKCAAACRYYAEHGPAIIADQHVDLGAQKGLVRPLPLGVILAVMPWNFPLWQVVRFLAPAIMAGNAGVLKHAHFVPGCALALEETVRRAGAPEGLFQNLFIDSGQVAKIVADPRIAAVTLTGSEGAGMAVAAAAGRALKKVVLELGGSDPFIVMPSADQAEAAKVGLNARMMNAGQSCVCAKRFIVHADVYDAFVAAMVEGAKALKVGDPMDPATRMGPLASVEGRDTIAAQVDKARAAGGRVLTGGEPLPGPGAFYAPTVIVDLPRDADIAQEEFFGPVAVIHKVADIDDAIALANDVNFGLGSSVWTRDEAERERFINDIEAGITAVNAMVASDPRMPFGGVKRSGHGRELGRWGLLEFVNLKAVALAG